MRKLSSFTFISLNGFFQGANGDIAWHRHGAEENSYAVEAMKSESILLFGRKTYEMMAGFWPSPMAKENDPVMAKGMNGAEKIVFSRTLTRADWNNTTLLKGDAVAEIRRVKNSPGKDLTILGSGSIVRQCAEQGLIDLFQIMVDPVALGEGTPLFHGLTKPLPLNLVSSRQFKSGVMLLTFEPE
jgi:dihydrofolate reductase